ncbi:MAG: hypothetical protein AAFU64_15980 [Bacteroidota bacterium]
MNCLRCLLANFLVSLLLGNPSNPSLVKFDREKVKIQWINHQRLSLNLSFRVSDGFHIQSNEPTSSNLIASQVSLELRDGMEIRKKQFLVATYKQLTLGGETLSLIEGNFRVKVLIVFKQAPPPILKGKLSYQACSQKHCLMPRELAFVLRMQKD